MRRHVHIASHATELRCELMRHAEPRSLPGVGLLWHAAFVCIGRGKRRVSPLLYGAGFGTRPPRMLDVRGELGSGAGVPCWGATE